MALGIAIGVLLGGCGVERVTAVEGADVGSEAGTPSLDGGRPGEGGPDGSSGDEAVAEPACTMANATCTSDDESCSVGNYDLYDNQWNCGANHCGPESAYGCKNPDGTVAFTVTSNQVAGNTTVLAYSAMQDNFDKSPLLTSFQTITATFEETSPHVGIYEDTFDIWLNGVGTSQSIQVMVWVDTFGRTPPGSQTTQTTLGGRTYDVWSAASPMQVTLVSTEAFTSGTVDLLQILDYAIAQGLVPINPTLGQIDFGVEIASTGGQSATFQFDDISFVTQ